MHTMIAMDDHVERKVLLTKILSLLEKMMRQK
jgi:hypothetical protein